MNPTYNHLRTFFLTTSFITRFNLLWYSMEGFAFSSKRILCMQIDGLILLKSSIDQAIASLCFLRISTTSFFFSIVKSATMIVGLDFSSPGKAYFKCLGFSFRISPSELFSTFYPFTSLLLKLSSFSSLWLITDSISSAFSFSFSLSSSSL